MGLALDYFYSLTPREFDNALQGFRNREERAMRAGWEQTRMLMWAVLSPHKKPGTSLSPQSLLPFDWDKALSEGYTPEEEARILQENLESRKRWEERDRRRAERKRDS